MKPGGCSERAKMNRGLLEECRRQVPQAREGMERASVLGRAMETSIKRRGTDNTWAYWEGGRELLTVIFSLGR